MKHFLACLSAAVLLACNVQDKKVADNLKATAALTKEGRDAMTDSSKSTTIQWVDPVMQNLGNISRGQVAEITWKFRNTGNHPLFVTDVHAGCGCTIPEKPEEPIAPGAEGVIKAKFNSSNFEGHVTKEVYVQANNSNRNNETNNKLSFTAEIK